MRDLQKSWKPRQFAVLMTERDEVIMYSTEKHFQTDRPSRERIADSLPFAPLPILVRVVFAKYVRPMAYPETTSRPPEPRLSQENLAPTAAAAITPALPTSAPITPPLTGTTGLHTVLGSLTLDLPRRPPPWLGCL